MAYLTIENFNKSFGQNEVLKGIDMSVEKGEVISIIGSSGSGKTTLLRCINFLEFADSGKMVLDGETLIDGDSAKKESENELRKKRLNFGLVFQSFNLFPQYSVFDNITLAPLLKLKEDAKDLKKSGSSSAVVKEFLSEGKARIFEEAEDLLRKIDLVDKRDAYPCSLSGGQQQRVAIARALALKPKVLCFDEPTSALDPLLTGEVFKVIRSLKDDDRTMIIVTHEMGFARNVSDKVVFMYNGVIAEEGTPDILSNPSTDELKAFLKNVNEKDG
jgi:polar amino acid transport system ATP-binding protein